MPLWSHWPRSWGRSLTKEPLVSDAVGDTIAALLKQFIVPLVVKSIMAYLVKKLPFLGLSWVNPIVGILVNIVAQKVLEHAARFIKFTVIDMDTQIDVNRYNKAVDDLAQAIDLGDPAITAEAKEKAKAAARDLIRFKK